jgi:tRNA G18 (ribose-2'-O)-methylase SpoU
MAAANRYQITNIDHPLLEPYHNLRNRNWTWRSGIFVAEGPLLVQRLLASSYATVSVLVEHKLAAEYEALVPSDVPLIMVEHELVEQLLGFNFHRGVLACGRRLPILELPSDISVPSHETWLGLFGVQDPENLGGMLRTAAGMGICRILLGPGTADPLSRRALRVSMGNTWKLEFYRSLKVQACLNIVKSLGIELVATSLGENSQPLETARRQGPLMLLMGNEKHGLPEQVLNLADRRVRIDMELGTDSLNVGNAASIAMYHFCRIATQLRD